MCFGNWMLLVTYPGYISLNNQMEVYNAKLINWKDLPLKTLVELLEPAEQMRPHL